MCRGIALLTSFILLVPLIGLLGNRCDQAPCCSPTFCPLPAGHTHHQSSTQESDCHHAPAMPANCELKAGCSHSSHDGALAPLPPAVLNVAAELPAPEIARAQIAALPLIASSAFDSVPSPPPRN